MLDIAFFNDKRGYGRYLEHRIKSLASQCHIDPEKAMQIVLTGMILKSSELETFCESHTRFLPLIISAREELQNPAKREHLIYAIKEIIKPYSDWSLQLKALNLEHFTIEQCLKGDSEMRSYGLDFFCEAMENLPIYFYCGNSDYNPLNAKELTHVDIDYNKYAAKLKLNFYFLKLMQLFYPQKLKSIHFDTYGSSVDELQDVVALFDASLLANTSVRIVADKISKEAELNVWEMVPSIEINLQSDMSFKDEDDWYYRLLQNTRQLKVSFKSDSLKNWLDWHKEELFGLLNKRTSFTLVIAGKSSSIELLKEMSEWMDNTSIILNIEKPNEIFNKTLKKEFGDRLIISETGEMSLDLSQFEHKNIMSR
jgi:hypothetical protein